MIRLRGSAQSDGEFHDELLRHTPTDGWPSGLVTLTSWEAAKYLRISQATLRQWLRRGQIERLGPDEYDMGSLLNTLVAELRRAKGVAS